MNKSIFTILTLSLLTGLGRFYVPGHAVSWAGTYEAFAHIWVGVLLAISVMKPEFRKLSIGMLLVITILEALMFFHRG